MWEEAVCNSSLFDKKVQSIDMQIIKDYTIVTKIYLVNCPLWIYPTGVRFYEQYHRSLSRPNQTVPVCKSQKICEGFLHNHGVPAKSSITSTRWLAPQYCCSWPVEAAFIGLKAIRARNSRCLLSPIVRSNGPCSPLPRRPVWERTMHPIGVMDGLWQ